MDVQKCPECDWEITNGGVLVTVGDKQILFCCDDCAKAALGKSEAKSASTV